MKTKRSLRYYPLAVSLKNRTAVVVGGGAVAERKARSLAAAGAGIKLISPGVTAGIRRMSRRKGMRWIRRKVKSGDMRGAYVVIAATDDASVNEAVSRWARRHGAWVNVVDEPVLSDFISPAAFDVEDAIVTVYTDGRDPVLSRDLKNFLKERWNAFLHYRDSL